MPTPTAALAAKYWAHIAETSPTTPRAIITPHIANTVFWLGSGFALMPWSIIAATASGMSAGETVGMSAAVFAGASQIMATEMIAGGAGSITIILATLVINLRHIIMSTCVFRKLTTKNWLVRILAGFGVTDETFAIYTTESDEKSDEYFMLGLITISYSSWVIGALVGVILQRALPDSLSQSFGIALYALFIALLVPNVKGNVRLLFVVIITAIMNFVLQLFIEPSAAPMQIDAIDDDGNGFYKILVKTQCVSDSAAWSAAFGTQHPW